MRVARQATEKTQEKMRGWLRHHTPGNATTEQVEASIDDATHVIVRLLPPFLAFCEEPCDNGPLLIFQVRRISFAFHGSSLPSRQCPTPFQQLTKSNVTPMVLLDFGIIFAGQPLRARPEMRFKQSRCEQ